jgi:multiple sugar transport system permease protein
MTQAAAPAATETPHRGFRRRGAARRELRRFWLAPATTVTLLLTIAPLLITLGLSFTNVHLSRQTPFQWTISNWSRLFGDEGFRQVMINMLWFVVLGVTIQYLLGLALALALDLLVVKGRWLRVMVLTPMMISPMAVGFIVGRMMLGPEGPVVQGLNAIGLHEVVFFRTPIVSKLSLILVDTWQWTPLITLILLVGLQMIPKSLKESAYVDGASDWQTIRHIVLPLLGTASLTAIALRMLEAFKIVDIIVAITGGGPGRATETVTLFVYNTGVNNGDVAYAATAGFAMLGIVIFTITVLLAVGRRLMRTPA